MGTTTSKLTLNDVQGNSPYSNSFVESFQFTSDADGYFLNSDKPATAVGASEIVRLGKLPAGLELHSALAAIGDAFTASTVFSLGFAYVDGVDETNVPQDDDYFFAAGTSSATAAVLASTKLGVSRVTLPKDAYLILTNGAVAHTDIGRADFVVFGKMRGVK